MTISHIYNNLTSTCISYQEHGNIILSYSNNIYRHHNNNTTISIINNLAVSTISHQLYGRIYHGYKSINIMYGRNISESEQHQVNLIVINQFLATSKEHLTAHQTACDL